MQYGYEAIYNLLTFSGFADLPKVNSAVIFFYFVDVEITFSPDFVSHLIIFV